MPNKPLVLIVEDSTPSGRLIQSLVELSGGTSQLVASGSDALEAISVSDPFLIIMDLRLPDGSGSEFAEKIRELKGDKIHIWACSGQSADELVETAWDNLPFNGWLPKPFDVHEVTSKLTAVLKA